MQLDQQEMATRNIIKETEAAWRQYKAASDDVDAAVGALQLLSRSLLFDTDGDGVLHIFGKVNPNPSRTPDTDVDFFKEVQLVFETAGTGVRAVGTNHLIEPLAAAAQMSAAPLRLG